MLLVEQQTPVNITYMSSFLLCQIDTQAIVSLSDITGLEFRQRTEFARWISTQIYFRTMSFSSASCVMLQSNCADYNYKESVAWLKCLPPDDGYQQCSLTTWRQKLDSKSSARFGPAPILMTIPVWLPVILWTRRDSFVFKKSDYSGQLLCEWTRTHFKEAVLCALYVVGVKGGYWSNFACVCARARICVHSSGRGLLLSL